jgi:CheY-like chemotaxis protein
MGNEKNEKKQLILCVDDDKKNLELLEALLSPLGYDLELSSSGEDALNRIAQRVPDLMLLDIMMPEVSGLEVLEQLRSREKTRDIPVVLVTALHAAEDKAKGLKAGCDDFISKPFDENELIARVRSLLKISGYRKSLEEKETAWNAVFLYASNPMIVCGTDWVITNLNQAAQRYLMPGSEFKKINFLDFIYEHYTVSVPWSELNDCTTAPKKFKIEKKGSERSVIQRAEVHLEVFENAFHEVVNIVLTLRDIVSDSKS